MLSCDRCARTATRSKLVCRRTTSSYVIRGCSPYPCRPPLLPCRSRLDLAAACAVVLASSSRQLSSVQMFTMTHLELIDLSHNSIEVLPAEVRAM